MSELTAPIQDKLQVLSVHMAVCVYARLLAQYAINYICHFSIRACVARLGVQICVRLAKTERTVVDVCRECRVRAQIEGGLQFKKQ